MRTIILFLFLFSTSMLSHAVTRSVPSVYPTIQEGILAAENGDTVLVAEGEYFENIDFRGRNIVVGSLFVVDADLAHIPNTIINGSQPEFSDSGSVVRIINGEDSTAALIGFTITGGTGTKFRDQSDQQFYVEGGGILIENSNPLIAHNSIINNEATRELEGTTSSGGGGIRYGYSAPRIYNNVIMFNEGRYGGGVVSFFADGDLRHNVIANNEGGQDYGGGGLWIGGAGHTTAIYNNDIVDNSSVLAGGGIRRFAGVLNGHSNIIWGNRASSGAQQVGGTGGSIQLEYCCVEDNLEGVGNIDEYPEFSFQNLGFGPSSPCHNAGHPDSEWNDEDESRNDIGIYGGPGASSFPEFGGQRIVLPTTTVEFDETSLIARILRANKGTSAVIIDSSRMTTHHGELAYDMGADILFAFNSDIFVIRYIPYEGIPRPFLDTLRVYHNDSLAPNPMLVPLRSDASLIVEDATELPNDFALHPAYPNPFNPSTAISFALPSEQSVTLTVIDIQGREIALLMQDRLAAGEHLVEWNAAGFASGVYFATLRAGKWISNQKLLLLK